ncbi:hypothetical protein [Flavobacterium sp. 25HG05S-40]|uniref:hypothetical protein n=1 Tax=Flavobacterium sp. 25HG05S-40 TaxID=3458682 RepID=UPI0040448AF1
MKNNAHFFIAIASAFFFNGFAQSSPIAKDFASENDLAVVSYHVEERINMNFGGSITTYNVPNLSLVSDKQMVGNNVRIITPKYAKIRAKSIATTIMSNREPKSLTNLSNVTSKLVDAEIITTSQRKRLYVDIDVVGTYERIMDKGYKSVAMITKVADRHFFDGDLVLAAKWYTELFNTTTSELEAVYYYRYAQSLLAVGQIKKGNEMMRIFESKSL